ncbi:MAG: glycosyltransferase [Prevotellaceae bacterium]|nr:glycosyltransferase [Candidatus Faecinaster equi]
MKKEEAKIVVLSTSDKVGGAAFACYQYVRMLRDHGYEAFEVVRQKTDSDPFVLTVPADKLKKKSIFQRVVNKIAPPKKSTDLSFDADKQYIFFGNNTEHSGVCTESAMINTIPFTPTLVLVGHVHNFITMKTLVNLKKIWNCQVFIMCQDISPYTGGCHVHRDCMGFMSDCSDCPAFTDSVRKREVADNFAEKKYSIIEGNIGVAYSTKWLYKDICSSSIFKNQPKFAYSMHTDVKLYSPAHRGIAKNVFDIEPSKKTIMCGSYDLTEERKGLVYFMESLKILWNQLSPENRENIVVIMVGQCTQNVKELIKDLPPFEYKIVEFIKDFRYLSLLYQATDIYVCPTLEDAGPMMVADAMSCGTPVVGFKTGLMIDTDIFLQGETGYVVELRDSKGLAEGILLFLEMTEEERQRSTLLCREVVVNHLSEEQDMILMDNYIAQL